MTESYKPEHEARQAAIRDWQVYCRGGHPSLRATSRIISPMLCTWSDAGTPNRIRYVLPSGIEHSGNRTQGSPL
jgi:hypothetical protein